MLSAMFAASVAALFLGKHGQAFASMGVLMIPLGMLVVASHLGERLLWARMSAVVLAFLLALLVPAIFASQAAELIDATRAHTSHEPEAPGALLGIWMISLMGMGVAGLVLHPRVRVALARFVPMDPDRFVHAVALALVVTLTVSSFAPLVVLGEPVFTGLAMRQPDKSPGGALPLEQLYQLIWLVPVCILAAGYGTTRNLTQAVRRLGLTRPTFKQAWVGVGVALALAVIAIALGAGIGWLWHALGWASTNEEGLDQLMGHMFSPAGAVIVGISAGLGEELLVRGALQPALGILPSNLVFTAMHAGQYNWDFLLVIFVVGLGFGLVRKHGSTTMSAWVHGLYDMMLIALAL